MLLKEDDLYITTQNIFLGVTENQVQTKEFIQKTTRDTPAYTTPAIDKDGIGTTQTKTLEASESNTMNAESSTQEPEDAVTSSKYPGSTKNTQSRSTLEGIITTQPTSLDITTETNAQDWLTGIFLYLSL